MPNVACESLLRAFVRTSMHPCPGNWVAIGCAVVYYARDAHAFSAGITWQENYDPRMVYKTKKFISNLK